jgi:DNA primase
LRALNVPAKDEGTEWVNAPCPLAPFRHKGGTDANPSFGVNLEGSGRVYCFACQFAGSLTKLVMELQLQGAHLQLGKAMEIAVEAAEEAPIEIVSSYEERYLNGPRPVVPYPEWFREMFDPAYWEGQVHPYLQGRYVSYEFAEAYDLRVATEDARIVFPVRTFEGELAGLHGRSYAGSAKPYHAYPYEGHTNRHVWLGEHLIDRAKPVLFVESVFDVAAVWPIYQNVLSPLAAGIQIDQLVRINWVQKALLMFDGDEAGRLATTKMRSYLEHTTAAIVELDENVDPGDMDEIDLAEAIWPALNWLEEQ